MAARWAAARDDIRREYQTNAATSKTAANANQPQEFAKRFDDEHDTQASPARKNSGAQREHNVLVCPRAQLASPGSTPPLQARGLGQERMYSARIPSFSLYWPGRSSSLVIVLFFEHRTLSAGHVSHEAAPRLA